MKYLKFRKNKRTWSGKEAGQLFFMGLAEQAAYAKGEKPATEPPEITGELLGIAQDAIPNKRQEQFIYAFYRSLYYSISNYYNTVNKEISTFYYTSNNLEHKLEHIQARESLLREIESVPLIMTAADYESKRQEAVGALRKHKTSVYEAFFTILATSLADEKNTPKTILDALEELKRTPATNSTLFTLYEGKNELDQEDADPQEERNNAKYIFERADTCNNNPDNSILEEATAGKPQAPRSQSKTPDNLTLYDLLPQVIKLSVNAAQVDGTALKREYLNEIKRELPELYGAILDLIKQTPQAHGLKATQYYKDFATIAQLEEAGLFGYDIERTAATAELGEFYEKGLVKGKYSEIMRAIKSGVAITERANYSEQKPLQTQYDILAEVTIEKERAKLKYDMLHSSLKQITAFNAALEIIATQFDIPQATAAQVDYSEIIEWADNFNKRIEETHNLLYGDNEEIEEKSRRLKDVLPLIDLSDAEPTDEQVAKGAYVLNEMAETFETGYQLINLKQLVAILQE